MPQEEDPENSGQKQRQSGDGPNNQREQHSKVDDDLLLISLLGHLPNVYEELYERGIVASMFAFRNKLSLHDGPECHRVDGHSWALGDDDEKSTFELEVRKQSQVIHALSAPRQFGKDQKSAPTLAALRQAHTLEDSGKRFEVALGNAAGPDNA